MWRRGARHTMPLGMEVARSTRPYRLRIVANAYVWRPFTPPYPKGGASGGAHPQQVGRSKPLVLHSENATLSDLVRAEAANAETSVQYLRKRQGYAWRK